MKSENEKCIISELLELRRNKMLTVNPEYQRGAVWNILQQKKLIDSILRGYPLPLIYLHHKKKSVAGMMREDLEIIDGQQRLNAIELFEAGGITLFDPILDDKVARFPKFVKDQPCPWARQNYDSLTIELQDQFLNTEISVAKIITENDDEARDLFIRLQAGLPLNSQEKRDAWPGGYTDFVLKIGGKTNNVSYPGNDFFKELVARPSTDRGQIRQLCAQISMLYFEGATNDKWVEISNIAIDDYYYKNLSFDRKSKESNDFQRIINKAYSLLGNRGLKKLKGHEVIHLILLIDSLMNGYSPSWELELFDAFEEFRKKCIYAKKDKLGEYWNEYVQWTMTSSDTKSSLIRRHNFFIKKMYELLKPQPFDSTRIFGDLERQLIFYRDSKICQVCKSPVNWSDLEIHHVIQHQYGGQTVINNGVTVHKVCHPKGKAANDFAETLCF
jgi:hypothetical protein